VNVEEDEAAPLLLLMMWTNIIMLTKLSIDLKHHLLQSIDCEKQQVLEPISLMLSPRLEIEM